MKIITLFCCLLLFLSGCSNKKQPAVMQGSLTGFLDIQWGDSPDSVKSKMLQVQGVEFISDSAGGSWYRGGSFMGHEVQQWILDFWKGEHFNFARIQFKHDSASAVSLVHDLESRLQSQYGNTPEPRTWRFSVGGEDKTNVVSIFYDPSEPVAVWYGAHGYVDSLERALK